MIDLKELEKSLDEALANETSESLSKWLLEQRKDNLANFLGLGYYEHFQGNPYSFNQNCITNVQFNVNNNNTPGDKFTFAA